jgi:hypothetical protein
MNQMIKITPDVSSFFHDMPYPIMKMINRIIKTMFSISRDLKSLILETKSIINNIYSTA